ncbi:hypothetical protein BU16DRAFT_365093 [Lophium mytilinum]|uniref:Uncharacterized protein n=1 Tax=Lophium mytilinum TaxID=390894 RepID=A0A6A6QV34_9PEZI|nr:hypothetical protein BU16DRAFT_365093 [Lophium mytilinum]
MGIAPMRLPSFTPLLPSFISTSSPALVVRPVLRPLPSYCGLLVMGIGAICVWKQASGLRAGICWQGQPSQGLYAIVMSLYTSSLIGARARTRLPVLSRAQKRFLPHLPQHWNPDTSLPQYLRKDWEVLTEREISSNSPGGINGKLSTDALDRKWFSTQNAYFSINVWRKRR